MNAIKLVLYGVGGLCCLGALITALLPWDTLNALIGLFGPFGFPDQPLVQYTVKTMMVIVFWIGVLIAVAVSEPEKYQLILAVLAGTFLSSAAACLAVGWIYGVPWFFYFDAVFLAVGGALLAVYRRQALKAGA